MASPNSERKFLLPINLQTRPHPRRHNPNLHPHLPLNSRHLRSSRQLRRSHRPSPPPTHRRDEPELCRETPLLLLFLSSKTTSPSSPLKSRQDLTHIPHHLPAYCCDWSNDRSVTVDDSGRRKVEHFRRRAGFSYILLLHPPPRPQWSHRSIRFLRCYESGNQQTDSVDALFRRWIRRSCFRVSACVGFGSKGTCMG